MRKEHDLTPLTAFGIALLLLSVLLIPQPVYSTTPPPEPPRAAPALATAEPPQQIQPQPPAETVPPPVTGTREPPKATAEPSKPDALTERVAKALGLPPEALTLLTAFNVTWTDSCLGCPQPGEQCLQVITAGEQRLYQGPGGRQYDVRTGRGEQFIICTAVLQAAATTAPSLASSAAPGAAVAPVAEETVAGSPAGPPASPQEESASQGMQFMAEAEAPALALTDTTPEGFIVVDEPRPSNFPPLWVMALVGSVALVIFAATTVVATRRWERRRYRGLSLHGSRVKKGGEKHG